MTPIKQHTGMSTIQSLIILAVLSILLLNGVSGFTQLKRYYEVVTTTQQVQHFLKQAKLQASLQARTLYTNFKFGTNWCIAVTHEQSCTCETQTTCPANSIAMTLLPPPNNSTSLVNHSFSTPGSVMSIAFSAIVPLNASLAGTLRIENSHYRSGVVLSSLNRVRQCSNILASSETFTC